MAFYEHIRAYREQLEITQVEAAKRLGIDHSVLSKYEKGALSIPIDLLPRFAEVYSIPEHLFTQMILGKSMKSRDPGLEARESRARYIQNFQEEVISKLIHLKEFRDLSQQILESSTNDQEMKQYIKQLKKH